jgi:phosphoserine phosphatase
VFGPVYEVRLANKPPTGGAAVLKMLARNGLKPKVDDGRILCAAEAALSQQKRREVLDQAEELGVDVFLLPARRPRPRLFVFDMDSTLIQAEIIDELAGLAGVKDKVAAITERAMRGEIDFRGALAERLALLKGVREERLRELTDSVLLSEGLEEFMRGLKIAQLEIQVKTAIVSGGFGFFARHLQQRLGFDYLVSNELEIVDGALTGRVAAEIVDASRKAAALQEFAAKEGVALDEVVAVGDGANDVPMLKLAGIGVAYRAKPILKAAAEYRLTFANLDALLTLL